jgi:RNA polymerase sigma factor (sigma-70 family)
MGETATVLGSRQLAERGSVVSHSDEELIAGVRAGVPVAFEEIYDRYAPGILAFCAHMLASRDAAEDALQLTFVAAYRALRDGENSIVLRPWLYTIARNRCLSELRARRDAIGVDELADRPVFEGLADQVQRREDLREMLDDLRRLPADQRAALVLFELGDHPQKEIASVLGVRTEKVKALVFQARQALVRGRQARQHPCGDIREQLATMEGRVPARSLLRAHIERCPGCQSFEYEVRHQRAALALILPVALAGELKASVLGSVLHGGGAVAAACGGGGGAIAAGGGGSAAAAGACGGGAVAGGATAAGGASAIGGATAVGGIGAGAGVGSAGAVSAAAAGGVAGAGAVVTSGPIVAAATGLTALGESVGVGGLGASGVMAKLLTAAAIATVAASAGHDPARPLLHGAVAPPSVRERLVASVPARPAARTVPGSLTRPGTTPTPTPGSVTSTPADTPSAPSSSTPTTSGGGTSSPTPTTGSTGLTPPAGTGGSGGSDGQPPSSVTDPNPSPLSTTSAPPASSGQGSTSPLPAASDPAASPTSTGSASPPDTSAPAAPSAASGSTGTSAPADATPTTSSTGTSPSTPAADSSPAGTASGGTGSGSSGPSDTSSQNSGPVGAPTASAVGQTPPPAGVQADAAAQVSVSAAASAPAQDATAAAG